MARTKQVVATAMTAEPATKNEIAVQTQAQPPVQHQTSELANVLTMLERVISNPDYPIEKVEQAFTFMQRVRADQAKQAWTRAFVAACSKMEQVRREASSDKGKYASFEAIDAATRPHLSAHGMQFTHTTEPSPFGAEWVRVVSYLMHEDGHRERYEIDMPADGKGAKGNDVMTKTHAVASAMTYGKRYNVGNACNIATYKDDDGKAASRPIKELMSVPESEAKRDTIMRDIISKARPISPQDLEDVATKWASDVSAIRPEHAEQVRDQLKRWQMTAEQEAAQANVQAKGQANDGL